MIPPSLNHAMKQFPEHKNILETHYRKNESFRSLCKNFHDCAMAVEYWCKSAPDKKHVRELCEEYKALFAEFKDEITKWLVN
jgi:hypothetical protein